MLTRTALPLPRGTFKRIQIYLMFPTGAGLAPKEAIQARSKQDAHEALCATRKTSREDAERRRRASKIPAQDLSCLLLMSCSCSLGQRKSEFPPHQILLFIFFSPRRGSMCCLSHVLQFRGAPRGAQSPSAAAKAQPQPLSPEPCVN